MRNGFDFGVIMRITCLRDNAYSMYCFITCELGALTMPNAKCQMRNTAITDQY